MQCIGFYFKIHKKMRFSMIVTQKLLKPTAKRKRFRQPYVPEQILPGTQAPAESGAATAIPLCDIVYASENAYFYTPFTALGICPEACSTFTFPRILGSSKASEMLLLSQKLSAREALQFKFVSDLYAGAELETKIWPRVQEFAKLSPWAMQTTKKKMRHFDENTLMAACEFEVAELRERLASDEFRNAMMNIMSRKAKTKL